MLFAPTDPTPTYPNDRGDWVEDKRFVVGNITAMLRKPLTLKGYDKLMRQAPGA